VIVVLAASSLLAILLPSVEGGPRLRRYPPPPEWGQCAPGSGVVVPEVGGNRYGLGSPEEDRRRAGVIYISKCLRCHSNDGRGVWDIPNVPDFRNVRWQAYLTDEQLFHAILEGRGAVMPAFRGQFTLDEAWALVRYIRGYAADNNK
jgi:mono/diheme cytochrome c family protein